MSTHPIHDRQLERQGRRFATSAGRLLLIAAIIAIPGVVLVAVNHAWSFGFGIALICVAAVPGIPGLGLLGSSLVARWSSRHRSFA